MPSHQLPLNNKVSESLSLSQHTGLRLAACTSRIILRIVSSSYGRVEDLEVMKSMVPMLASVSEIPTQDQPTHRRNRALISP